VLFRSLPQFFLWELEAGDIDTLFSSIKTCLQEMTKKQGRDTEQDLYGKPGGYRTILSNKTKGEPCPYCGGRIAKKAYMGGNVYFCPQCQPYDARLVV
jgi:formamidopyrimidine-DNA glycosylase